MIKLIRNNQKKVLAGVGVVLMISFVGSFGRGGGQGGRTDHEIGRAAGKPVLASDAASAAAELSAVNLFVRQPNKDTGQPPELVERVLGFELASAVKQKPQLFVMLRREAAANGIAPDPLRVRAYLDETLGGTADNGQSVDVPTPDSDQYQALLAGVSDLFAISENFGRVPPP